MRQDRKEIFVLVVDDEQAARESLSFELNSAGYSVVTAVDGVDALKKIKEQKFDLVFSDYKMPGMDGIELLKEIKKNTPGVEFVMMTAYGTVENAVASLKEGAYDFVQKPYSFDKILAVIDNALEKKELKVLVALYESSKAVFSKTNLPELLGAIMDIMRRVLQADEGSIMLLDKERKLYIAASHGLDKAVAAQVRLDIGERISGKVCQEKQGRLLVDGLSNYPEFSKIESKSRIGSSIIIPLLFGDDALGVLNLARLRGHKNFDSFDYRSASIFSSQVAQAIQNVKLFQTLENKIDEVSRVNSILFGREKRVIELKKEVDQALQVGGKPPKYRP